MDDWFFHEQTEEYQRCWRLHSEDGNNPELDYNELIFTIVKLTDRIEELEKDKDWLWDKVRELEHTCERNKRYYD